MRLSVRRVVFTDILGVHREVVYVGHSNSSESPYSAIGIDGSSVYGFGIVEKSDVFVVPVRDSCIRIQEDGSELNVGIICLDPDCSHRHSFDPRFILEETVRYLKNQGYEPMTGTELEFYVVKDLEFYVEKTSQELYIEPVNHVASGGVIKAYASSTLDQIKEEVIEIARSYSGYFSISKVHRENGVMGQYEISLGPWDPVKLSDSIILSINTLKRALKGRGLRPIFLPKPFPQDYGSGLHVHISLWMKGINLFDIRGKEIPEAVLYFVGGILEHASSLSAFVNPSINSYRRLVEGFEAPVYVSWGVANRTTMIRVPLGGNRVEIRNPDASMNPYFGLAAMLLAGLDGLKKKINPGDPIEHNVYHNNNGLRKLPRSLEEALDHLEIDNEYLKPVFPRQLIETYLELKREEARKARSIPTPIDYGLLPHLS
ncbi:MAG: glutamine synthetase family protein [Desulfurococcaceae archaeon]